MDARATLDALAAEPELAGRLVHRELLPARAACFAETSAPLHDEVTARLAARGFDRLYVHQAAAIDQLREGTSVVVATGTASGKSLCYQVPILESVVSEQRDRAARLPYQGAGPGPAALAALVARPRPARSPTTATPPATTALGAQNANVLLTNPEMLHMGSPPSHKRWATFLMRLRYVVVDELHTPRGIFGSQVARPAPAATPLRALRRVAHVLLRERDDRQSR
jgi:DEAD/DEAH box helicase domain-containing protein